MDPCKECKSLAGLSGTRTPHKSLSELTADVAKGYGATSFQTLYVCSDCDSVLAKGRNTGWVYAIAIATV